MNELPGFDRRSDGVFGRRIIECKFHQMSFRYPFCKMMLLPLTSDELGEDKSSLVLPAGLIQFHLFSCSDSTG